MKTLVNPNGNYFLIMDYGKSTIPVNTIKFIEGCGNYSTLNFRNEKPLLSSFTLKTFKSKLKREADFFSPHKSVIVNLKYLAAVEMGKGKKTMRLKDGKRLPVSRRKVADLMEIVRSQNIPVLMS